MRLRPGRGALIRRQRGVALHQFHATERDAELLGDQLRLRGVQSVAELALAGVCRHAAVGGDGDPRIELIAAGAVEPLRRHHAGVDAEPHEWLDATLDALKPTTSAPERFRKVRRFMLSPPSRTA